MTAVSGLICCFGLTPWKSHCHPCVSGEMTYCSSQDITWQYIRESMQLYPKSFSVQAEQAMRTYDWPGNVRALRHAIERAVILASHDVVEPEDLQLNYGHSDTQADIVAAEPVVLKLDEMEKATIQTALRKHGFNISHTAKELGLTRASLYRRMEKHDL